MTQPAASSSSSLPVTADLLAGEIIYLYTQAEQAILNRLARIAEGRGEIPMMLAMQREAIRVIGTLRARSTPLAVQVAVRAAEQGARDAARELADLPPLKPPGDTLVGIAPNGPRPHRVDLLNVLPPARRVAQPIGQDLAARLDATLPRILRFADDAYRAAIVGNIGPVLVGRSTGQLAQQAAWRNLTERGITGFVDTKGRRWNLASYVEMATRTAVQRSYNAAHLERMKAAGVTQFLVPGDGHPCPLCRPWEGRILTDGADSPTIAEATDAGLFHPNCRHTLTAYLPGHPKIPAPRPWTDSDQARYDAVQQLRSLEREVRTHKRAAAGAMTPLDAKRAQAWVRATQARIRAHIDQHGLVRRPRREQLDLGTR